MSSRPTEHEESLSEVNVIPLADLSLVLLIILMVMSPMVLQGLIQVTSGKAAAAQTKEELTDPNPEVPVIISQEPGALKINGVPVDSDLQFVTRLEAALSHRRDKSVNLTASPLMTHGKVVHVMDMIKHHGATSLVMLKWDAANAAMVASLTPSTPGAKS